VAHNCNFYDIDVKPRDPEDKDSKACLSLKRQFDNLTANTNVYDVYRRCFGPGPINSTSAHENKHLLGESVVEGEVKSYRKVYTERDYTPWLFNNPLLK
jgi:hypothetical protein